MRRQLGACGRIATVSLSLLASLLLSSCGGGDPFAGLWLGSLGGNRDVSAIVLGDGSYYMLYSRPGVPSAIGGLIQGSGDFHAARFTSTDARDFNWEGAGTRAATLSARISPRMSVEGAVNGTAFSASHVQDFDEDPQLAKLAGAFTGQVVFALGTRPATVTVTGSGQLGTTINGCAITGQVLPRRDANAYDVTIAFGGFPCVFPFAQFTGAAVYREDLRRLEAAVVHGSRTQAIAFTGIKQ